MDRPFTAYEGDEPYVFVCYAHDDAKIVYPELRWLRDQGVNVWYDEGISPGAEFPERLGNAILGACLLLFYVSPRSAASRHCRDEAYFALDHAVPVRPCHIVATDLPAGLALSTATTQGLMRHEMPLREYRRKLLAAIRQRAASSGGDAIPETQDPGERPLLRHLARLGMPIAVLAALAVATFGALQIKAHFEDEAEVRRANDELLPQIRSLIDNQWRDFTVPYALALEAGGWPNKRMTRRQQRRQPIYSSPTLRPCMRVPFIV